MALIRQTDRRTGTVYACEAEARWDPEKKQSRYGRRRLVGHVDPRTGEVVPNRPARAPSPGPRRPPAPPPDRRPAGNGSARRPDVFAHP